MCMLSSTEGDVSIQEVPHDKGQESGCAQLWNNKATFKFAEFDAAMGSPMQEDTLNSKNDLECMLSNVTSRLSKHETPTNGGVGLEQLKLCDKGENSKLAKFMARSENLA